ncbi:hypothetical protein OEA41_009660 [Lepraria neglecta]|uniref:Uncharacterized protein n=1 Tax=Lepraria neglecta TaxID=209136 RepID=A0AAD9Z688_9LECA|nr:hypothetical protein OEA41_009660 [Lepraria neglecta]
MKDNVTDSEVDDEEESVDEAEAEGKEDSDEEMGEVNDEMNSKVLEQHISMAPLWKTTLLMIPTSVATLVSSWKKRKLVLNRLSILMPPRSSWTRRAGFMALQIFRLRRAGTTRASEMSPAKLDCPQP